MADAKATISVGAIFQTFEEFKGAVFNFGKCRNIFVMGDSKKSKWHNEDGRNYEYVTFVCKQGGKMRPSRSKGIRPNQSTVKCGCPVKVRAVSSRNADGSLAYKITQSVLEHNHSTTELIRKKWKDLQAQAKRDLLSRKRQSKPGMPRPPPEGEFTPIVLSMLSRVGAKGEDVGGTEFNIDSIAGLQTTNSPSSAKIVIENMTGIDGSCSNGSESVRSVENGEVCLVLPEEQVNISDLLSQSSREQNDSDNKAAEMRIFRNKSATVQHDEGKAVKRKASASTSATTAATATTTTTTIAATTSWMTEKEMLEKEKLKMEIEVLKLKRAKLKLEIGDLIQKKTNDSEDLI